MSRLVFVRGGSSSSSSYSQSSLSSSSGRDRFLPRPRHVISGYSHCLLRFAHCLPRQVIVSLGTNSDQHQVRKTHWQVLSWLSPGTGRHCIFRRRQKRQANLARNTGRLRPNRGRVKADSRALLLSRADAAGAPIEDDGRDDRGESGLEAADWSSLADPGNAGWSWAR